MGEFLDRLKDRGDAAQATTIEQLRQLWRNIANTKSAIEERRILDTHRQPLSHEHLRHS